MLRDGHEALEFVDPVVRSWCGPRRGSEMKPFRLPLAVAATATTVLFAQQPALERLTPEQLDVVPPSPRVTGTLARLKVE